MTADTTEASPPHDDRPLDRHQPRARHLAALSWRRGLAISFAIVFIVEALIMGAFAVLHIEFSIWTEAFIDSTVLALGAGVLAWFLVVRPLGTELNILPIQNIEGIGAAHDTLFCRAAIGQK